MGMMKVTRNYQVTLPKDSRKLLNIKVGDILLASQKEEGLVIKKFEEDVVKAAAGTWKSVEDSVKYVREMRAEYAKRAKRLGI
ncbi:AbrB/MazE/SpoVT family DNA-binding domain-containing protein [Candidatus Woesearchaeota archaeon]|nr:AbrB/MazE/SpoVT family DNA-binding domain-containing protein [Candidatus Woesearchaeota archaeon]